MIKRNTWRLRIGKPILTNTIVLLFVIYKKITIHTHEHNSVTLCMLANCGQSYRGIMLVIITRILFFPGEVWKSCQQRQKNNNFRELIKEINVQNYLMKDA